MDSLQRISGALPFLDGVSAGVTILGENLELVWANRFFRETLQEIPGLCGKHCFAGLAPQERRCEDCLPPLAQSSGRIQETIRTIQADTGGVHYYRVIASPLSNGDEGLICVMILPLQGEGVDSGSSWRERFMLSAIRNSNDAVFAVDRAHTVRFWNRGAETTFGWPVEEMVGRPVQRLFAGDDPREAGQVFTPRDPMAHLNRRELEVATRDRGDIWIEVSRTPLLDGSGEPNGFSFVVRDITERRQAAEQMAFTERMTAVGNMAATLAHEIGTPLGIISNNAENILLDLDEDDPVREELSTIVRETDRISGLIRDLLGFSRPEKPEMDVVEIHDVLHRVQQLVGPTAQKQGTELKVSRGTQNLPSILGDANQLEQVILNLTINALHAVEKGGLVSIEARAQAAAGAQRPGLSIVVADTGKGLPDEAHRIFDPFFTTKTNGTGLGLSVCRSLLDKHGGTLTAENGPGGGARFAVWLPIGGPTRP